MIHGCHGMSERMPVAPVLRQVARSTQRLDDECESHLRVLRHENHIVLVPVVVVHRDKPVAFLHEEVWQTTNQLLQKLERCYEMK